MKNIKRFKSCLSEFELIALINALYRRRDDKSTDNSMDKNIRYICGKMADDLMK